MVNEKDNEAATVAHKKCRAPNFIGGGLAFLIQYINQCSIHYKQHREQ